MGDLTRFSFTHRTLRETKLVSPSYKLTSFVTVGPGLIDNLGSDTGVGWYWAFITQKLTQEVSHTYKLITSLFHDRYGTTSTGQISKNHQMKRDIKFVDTIIKDNHFRHVENFKCKCFTADCGDTDDNYDEDDEKICKNDHKYIKEGRTQAEVKEKIHEDVHEVINLTKLGKFFLL